MLATQVQATSASYSWEDNSTILGSFSASHLEHTNDSEQALTGTFALKVNDIDPVDNSTPQSFVGWVFGLSDGDTVTASSPHQSYRLNSINPITKPHKECETTKAMLLMVVNVVYLA